MENGKNHMSSCQNFWLFGPKHYMGFTGSMRYYLITYFACLYIKKISKNMCILGKHRNEKMYFEKKKKKKPP